MAVLGAIGGQAPLSQMVTDEANDHGIFFLHDIYGEINRITADDADDFNVLSDRIEIQDKPFAMGLAWWVNNQGTHEVSIDCELNAYAALKSDLPYLRVGDQYWYGEAITGRQTITATFVSSINQRLLLYFGYHTHWDIFRKITWYIDYNNGEDLGVIIPEFSEPQNPITTTDNEPVYYNGIAIVASTANTITVRIAANTVSSTKKHVEILLHLSPYHSNANGTIEDIFTELADEWDKLYIKDGATNLDIHLESWNETSNTARVWVTIPLLTASEKDLTLEFDNTETVNTQSEMMEVIGF